MTESQLSLWPAAGSGEIPGLCCAGKGCEQVRFLLLHIVLDESPGISYVSQKVEAGAGIGLWKENKGKKQTNDALEYRGGREHPLLWGIMMSAKRQKHQLR